VDRQSLIEKIPPIITNVREMEAILDGQQGVIDDAWKSVKVVLNNQFIEDSDEYGISRWESILGITPKGTDTLEIRRFRIVARLNIQLPYSMPRLKEIMTNLCGEGNFSLDIKPNTYILTVEIGLSEREMFAEVERLLHVIVPENIPIMITLQFNRHSFFKKYTHRQLQAFTHIQLRNEVFDDE